MNSNKTAPHSKPCSEYMRYYPDKWAAISALRCNTGMGFSEATRTIEQLFGISHEDECRAADAEQEKIYQAQQAAEAQRKANATKARRKAGLALGASLYALFGTIFSISKKYK